jgi:hypothetical protein
MIDTRTIPASLYDADLPLPNVYFCTVSSRTGVHSLYLAADTVGSAVQKVRRHFREQEGLALYRSNSDIKLRRFRLGDYLENPQGLQQAAETARLANERSTVAALATRWDQVEALVAAVNETPDQDWAQVELQLGAALRAAG